MINEYRVGWAVETLKSVVNYCTPWTNTYAFPIPLLSYMGWPTVCVNVIRARGLHVCGQSAYLHIAFSFVFTTGPDQCAGYNATYRVIIYYYLVCSYYYYSSCFCRYI